MTTLADFFGKYVEASANKKGSDCRNKGAKNPKPLNSPKSNEADQ